MPISPEVAPFQHRHGRSGSVCAFLSAFQTPMVKEVICMGFRLRDIKKELDKIIQRSGNNYESLEAGSADLARAQEDRTQDGQGTLHCGHRRHRARAHLQEQLRKLRTDRGILSLGDPCAVQWISCELHTLSSKHFCRNVTPWWACCVHTTH